MTPFASRNRMYALASPPGHPSLSLSLSPSDFSVGAGRAEHRLQRGGTVCQGFPPPPPHPLPSFLFSSASPPPLSPLRFIILLSSCCLGSGQPAQESVSQGHPGALSHARNRFLLDSSSVFLFFLVCIRPEFHFSPRSFFVFSLPKPSPNRAVHCVHPSSPAFSLSFSGLAAADCVQMQQGVDKAGGSSSHPAHLDAEAERAGRGRGVSGRRVASERERRKGYCGWRVVG